MPDRTNTTGSTAQRPLRTVAEAAAQLSIGVRTLKALLAAGAIPVVRVSPGRVAIHPDDLDAYIARQRRE